MPGRTFPATRGPAPRVREGCWLQLCTAWTDYHVTMSFVGNPLQDHDLSNLAPSLVLVKHMHAGVKELTRLLHLPRVEEILMASATLASSHRSHLLLRLPFVILLLLLSYYGSVSRCDSTTDLRLTEVPRVATQHAEHAGAKGLRGAVRKILRFGVYSSK